MKWCLLFLLFFINETVFGQGSSKADFCYSKLNTCVNSCPGRGTAPGTVKGDKESQRLFFACQKDCYRQQDICNGKIELSPRVNNSAPILKDSTSKKITKALLTDEPVKNLRVLEEWIQQTTAYSNNGKESKAFGCDYSHQIGEFDPLTEVIYLVTTRNDNLGMRRSACLDAPLATHKNDKSEYCNSKGEYCVDYVLEESCIVSKEWAEWYQNRELAKNGKVSPRAACEL